MKITPDTQIIGQVKPGIYIDVTGVLLPDGSISAEQIKPSEYVITGTLERYSDEAILIEGIPIQVTPNTIINGTLVLGADVTTRAIRLTDGSLTARVIDQIMAGP